MPRGLYGVLMLETYPFEYPVLFMNMITSSIKRKPYLLRVSLIDPNIQSLDAFVMGQVSIPEDEFYELDKDVIGIVADSLARDVYESFLRD